MSYASEEQWTPITCPICGGDIWVMGDKAKPHHCDADPDDSLEQFVNNQLAPLNLQGMAKQILGFTRG